MVSSHRPLLLASLLLLGAGLTSGVPVARGDDVEAEARKWVELYGRERREPEFRQESKRWNALRQLGKLDTPLAREVLFDVFKRHQRSRRYERFGDGVVALRAIGPILDAEHVRLVVQRVAKRPELVHLQTLADSLAHVKRKDAATWLGTEGLRQKKEPVLAACVDALAHVAVPEACDRLIEIYEEHVEEEEGVDLAHGAVRALGKVDGPKVRKVLRRAAAHDDWRIRLAAADCLPLQKGLPVTDLDLLRVLLRDEQPIVRRAAARAAGEAKLEAVTRDLAHLLEAPRLRTRQVAHDALVRIAERELGWTPAPWHKWAQRDEDTEPVLDEGKEYDFGTYYGFDVLTDRVVFVVDMSKSMGWPWRDFHPKRYVAARKELGRVLEGLAEETSFNILLFEDEVHAWKRKMKPADEKSVRAAVKWVDKGLKRPKGRTNTYGALEQAFEDNPEADTVFLLSDGAPDGGDFDTPDAIVACVRAWNRYRRTTVHTITLTLDSLDRGVPHLGQASRTIEHFMKALADGTGGRYELVERVPEWMKEAKEE